MAKGGGGAWKVAYADFVTAMMAFFLVMWICSQDQKVKQAVARYFVTPMGVLETGASSRPNRTGAIFPSPTSGNVPSMEAVALGRGRAAHTSPGDVGSEATKVVSDWLNTTAIGDYWHNEAQSARDWARLSQEMLDTPGSTDEAARRHLAQRLRERITRNVQSESNDLSQELLAQILSEVNWNELAEDLLIYAQEKDPAAQKSPDQAAN